MKWLLLVAAVCIGVKTVLGNGAGRAIPIASENFVLELFKQINPRIQYDGTNFLVDLSGNYANCNFIGRRLHDVIRNRKTPEGASIGLIQDYTFGDETHTNAVDSYIRPVFESWVSGNDLDVQDFRQQISTAERFGCSVRPGCRGQVSVACLFSPAHNEDYDYIGDQKGPPKAKAFTFEQYDMAEQLTGQRWDSSHFLENLSGYETDCAMVHLDDFPFANATAEADKRGFEIVGLFGSSPNEGSTPEALEVILKNMKRVKSKMVGCSLIPDCIEFRQMYVVVSCIFEVSKN